MNTVWARTLCRLLVVLMIWSPVQFAQAGMIGTEQLVADAVSNVQADRNTVTQFLGRAEVANQLQGLGLDPATAAGRVASLSDQEVRELAGKINTLPAGGDTLGVVLVLLIVAAVVWYIWFRR